MAIQGRDASEIEWYLGLGISSFYKSTFGMQLSRAETFANDSEGIPIPKTVTRRMTLPDGNVMVIHESPNGWNYIPIKAEKRNPGYELDDEVLTRFARISRRMLAVERLDANAARCIEVYHGDEGARWGRVPGRGRIISLYPFTHVGTVLLRQMAEQDRKNKVDLDLRPADRLANYANAQLLTPKAQRAVLLGKMADEADLLYVEATRVWHRTTWGLSRSPRATDFSVAV